MLRKTFFLSIFALTALLLFAQTSQVEARRHHRSQTGLRVNVGTACSDTRVVRRYASPVIVPSTVYVPQNSVVYVPQTTYVPCYQQPVYLEEVYVERTPRYFGLGGFSFSWNFFN